MDGITAQVAELIAARGRGTTSALAEHLGVEKSTVSRWANGANPPDRRYWTGIEEFFELPAGALGVEGVKLTERVAVLEVAVRSLQQSLDRIERQLLDERGER